MRALLAVLLLVSGCATGSWAVDDDEQFSAGMNPAPPREALARLEVSADSPAAASSEDEERALEELRGPRPLKRRRPPKGMRFYVDCDREAPTVRD